MVFSIAAILVSSSSCQGYYTHSLDITNSSEHAQAIKQLARSRKRSRQPWPHALELRPDVFCDLVTCPAGTFLHQVDGFGRCESAGSTCVVVSFEKWVAHRSCVLISALDDCAGVRCLRGRLLGILLGKVFDSRVLSPLFHPGLEIFKFLLVRQSTGI